MSASADSLCIGKGERPVCFFPKMANRHGLIAGATGTGKTVTLQALAEQFSSIGVPVFLADVKGDLSGIAQPGGSSGSVVEKLVALGLSKYPYQGYPVAFWDVFGEMGHPVRTTISEIGPLLLSRILNLNETQTGVLSVIFKIADDSGLLLLDTKDLRALLNQVSRNTQDYMSAYGMMSVASIGAIQRNLLALDEQGGKIFFGEPALNLTDLIQTDANGQGMVNILAADRLIRSPAIYSTFLLWLISELFTQLPEIGDREKPEIVFFFAEAHLLFRDIPKPLLDKIEQVVRLIQSKGVGIYFVTQNPLDIPETVLGQLGNRVQLALRAFTPKDQKAVKIAALTFRQNPAIDTEKVITELGVGEALVSFLDEKGVPAPVERVIIYPPHSHIGPILDQERKAIISRSVIFGYYEAVVDRESAYEILKKRAGEGTVAAQAAIPVPQSVIVQHERRAPPIPSPASPLPEPPVYQPRVPSTIPYQYNPAPPASRTPQFPPTDSPRDKGIKLESVANTAIRIADSEIGRLIVRGVLGGMMGKKYL